MIMNQSKTPVRVLLTDDLYDHRYPVPDHYTSNMMATVDERWAVLESINIVRREDVTPLQAWRDAVADASGIARADLDPEQGGALDLGFSPAYVRKFVFYLA